MGGSGFGRSGRYVSIEGCQSYVLSAAAFNRACVERGMAGKTDYPFKDGFKVQIGIYTGDSPELRVKHHTNDGRDELIEYAVPLTWTVPPLEGCDGGSCVRQPSAVVASSICRTAAGAFSAAKPIGCATLAKSRRACRGCNGNA
jgi:hypothetical protein